MNTTAVTTCDNPSVSPYASTTFSEQPEPSSHVVTTATTRRDANGREDPPSLTELIHWIARPRPVWMRDAACREHPEVNFFPARGEDRRPALAVCGRCLVLNECRQWALHDAAHTGAVVTAVTVTLKHPDLTITHPTAVETGPNVWRIDWPTLDLHGRWYMHVAATGGLIAADEIWVDVEPAAAL